MQFRILVVDDESVIRSLFTDILGREGYICDAVSSGYAALMALEDHNYDLIFLDLRMPGINGIETLREIRKYDLDIPVYIVTGFYSEYMNEVKSVAEDRLDFELMDKPFGRNQILSVVRGIMSGMNNIMPNTLTC